jgi:hypothetical protein
VVGFVVLLIAENSPDSLFFLFLFSLSFSYGYRSARKAHRAGDEATGGFTLEVSADRETLC